MNKTILNVMNRANLTAEELKANATAAITIAANADFAPAEAAADFAADAAAFSDDVFAFNDDADFVDATSAVEHGLNKYFKESGEDRQLYLDELAKLNGVNNE